jgi:hypothetical protein
VDGVSNILEGIVYIVLGLLNFAGAIAVFRLIALARGKRP